MNVLNTYSAATFRTLGAVNTVQNLFTLENQGGSPIVLALRRLTLQLEATAALSAFMPVIRTARLTALPTGGTALGKPRWDTGKPASQAAVVARGATASDGGAATAITMTVGDVAWQQYARRTHTAIGQQRSEDNSMLPMLIEDKDWLLQPGEAVGIQVQAAVSNSNPATNHWMVQACWDELG